MHCLRRFVALATLSTLLFAVACAPRYTSRNYEVDRRIVYDPSTSFDRLLQNELREVNRGVEIFINIADLPAAHKDFRRWLLVFEEEKRQILDPDEVIRRYRLRDLPEGESGIERITEMIGEKTADLFGSAAQNRRRFLARRLNLTIRQRKNTIHLYFVRTP